MSDPTPPVAATPTRPAPSTTVAVTIAWLVVGLPAAWGVYQTAMKSMNLFRPPPATAVVAPTATTVPAR